MTKILFLVLLTVSLNVGPIFSSPCDGPRPPRVTTTTRRPPQPIDNNFVGHEEAPKFAPYYDVTLDKAPSLLEIYEKTGQKDFTLAFALGRSCDKPDWGGSIDLNEPKIIDQIRGIQGKGGEVIVATGGAVGPYLEHICTSVDSLAAAYKKVLDTVKTRHLDIDVEAPINNQVVSQALAKVQRERPDVTVSFTLPVQGDDYGLTDALGVDVLKAAKANGVNVHVVNAMTMEYPTRESDWGQSVIMSATAVLGQMKLIWPEKSDAELNKMLGVTPMLGRNFNGKIFTPAHAQKLVTWANDKHLGLLSFWSVGRDNGACAHGAISPLCSSIGQSQYEFTKIFKNFKG